MFQQKRVDFSRKKISCQQKKVDVAQNSISCRQKQDDANQKDILGTKKLLFFSGTARHIKLITCQLLHLFLRKFYVKCVLLFFSYTECILVGK